MRRHAIDTSTSFSQALATLGDLNELGDQNKREIETIEVNLQTSHGETKKETVQRERYVLEANGSLSEAVDLAKALGRPLLLQGEPGSGKTQLAFLVAFALGLPIERFYCKSTSRAQDLLYSYDAVSRLYDVQIAEKGKDGKSEDANDVRRYIHLGALGQAIARAQSGHRSVVLIDEIDKADLDFPNDLLHELDRLEFQVTEVPDLSFAVPDSPELRPLVFVTHNEEKALPAAFLRRCIFHYIEFPASEADLLRIVEAHHPPHSSQSTTLTERAIQVLLQLRQLDLSKKPGLSELIDWVGYLDMVKATPEQVESLPYMGILLKQKADQDKVEGRSFDTTKKEDA